MGPLTGMKVVEFAGIGPTPFCAMVLADLGADVVRIDRPTPPRSKTGTGVDSLTDGILGRGRRSVALDLKHPAGRRAALDLVADADALVEGFRPGVMERLGLGPVDCHARAPGLVYGRLTGWGQDGPLAQRAGHDINYIALAGALAPLGRRENRPVPPLNLLGDFAGGGLVLALGITAAVFERQRSGRGQVVDTAMVDGASYLMTMMYELLAAGRWDERREANANDGASPFYDTYETADGEYMAVGAMEPEFWGRLLQGLELSSEDLPDQWEPTAWPELSERLAAVFRTRTRDEWVTLLADTDACVTPVLRMSEAPGHPHHEARGGFVTVGAARVPAPAPRFSRTPSSAGRPAGRPGEHTAEVLAERGFSPERIEALDREGVTSMRTQVDSSTHG